MSTRHQSLSAGTHVLLTMTQPAITSIADSRRQSLYLSAFPCSSRIPLRRTVLTFLLRYRSRATFLRTVHVLVVDKHAVKDRGGGSEG
jgi:hypothetical protein